MWIKENIKSDFFGITITVTLEDLYWGSDIYKISIIYGWNNSSVIMNGPIFTAREISATMFYNSLCIFLRDKYSKFTPSEEPEE